MKTNARLLGTSYEPGAFHAQISQLICLFAWGEEEDPDATDVEGGRGRG